ncbi:hypothetical protein BJX76DRAFT_330095 [Aspergillus varians]
MEGQHCTATPRKRLHSASRPRLAPIPTPRQTAPREPLESSIPSMKFTRGETPYSFSLASFGQIQTGSLTFCAITLSSPVSFTHPSISGPVARLNLPINHLAPVAPGRQTSIRRVHPVRHLLQPQPPTNSESSHIPPQGPR